MRIIGGEFKRRKLNFRCDPSVRPMADRMKETLFNILGETVIESNVLDLFAGSGSLGLEALSRGARHVVFVESNFANCGIIFRNIEQFNLVGKAEIVKSDAEKALLRLKYAGKLFNLIFTDPPYNKGLTKITLLHLDQSDILAPHVRIICHHSTKENLPDKFTSLLVERSEKIGQARLSFLYRKV